MIFDIRNYIKLRNQVTIIELSKKFNIDIVIINDIISKWLRNGKLICLNTKNCTTCSSCSGCIKSTNHCNATNLFYLYQWVQ